MSNVVIVGLGYVGLPLALRAVEAGHTVIGIESNLTKIQSLEARQSYIEDVPSARIEEATATGRFRPVISARGLRETDTMDIGIITVPTPLRDDTREPDLTYVREAAKFLGQWIRPGDTVVLESTTYPGTTEELVAGVIYEQSGMWPDEYHLGFSPERVDPGNQVHTLVTTPKIVSGTRPESLEVIAEFYSSLVDNVVPVSSPRVAEMAKLFENTFAQVNIALVNEVALLCSKLGIDVDEVLDAAATKGHAIMRFRPGPGVGGHCIPVDPMYLAHHMRERHETAFRLAELADEINSSMPGHVVSRAAQILGGSVRDSRILVMGIAYKPNTSDIRESPSMDIVKILDELLADVTVADGHSPQWSQRVAHISPHEAVATAGDYDLVIIATDHDDVDYDTLHENATAILDTRNRLKDRDTKVHKL